LLWGAIYGSFNRSLKMGVGMAISSISSRLKALRRVLGVNQRDFCKGIYISQGYYAQIESEVKDINDRIIELISTKYRVNKDWLKTGKGGMFNGEPPDTDLNQLIEIYRELDPLFKNYVSLQIKQLLAVQKGTKGAEVETD
jgi:transcriptional regulator with XRE-family HTH domain